MSFGVGYINVQIIYQNLLKFDMPFTYDTHRNWLLPNPKLHKRWKMPIWEVVNFLCVVVLTYCVLFEVALFRNAEKASKIDPELFIVHGFIIVIIAQQLVTCYTFERDPPGVTHMVSSAFKILKIKNIGLPTVDRLPDFPEIFCYGVSTGFFLFPFIVASLPLLRPYDPINLLLANVICTPILRKLMSSCSYGLLSFYSSTSCCSYILLAMSTTHAFETLTGNIFRMTMTVEDLEQWKRFSRVQNKSEQAVVFWKRLAIYFAHKAIQVLSRYFNSKNGAVEVQRVKTFSASQEVLRSDLNRGYISLLVSDFSISNEQRWLAEPIVTKEQERYRNQVKTFRQVYRLHGNTQMLITVSNKSVESYVPVMTGVGMSICVVVNFTMIKAINYIQEVVVAIREGRQEFSKQITQVLIFCHLGIVTGGLLVIVMIGLIVFFCAHASQPALHSEKYIHFWRYQHLPALERRQARAMKDIAFQLGPFFKARTDTALKISHKILDLTITLLLGLR